jgi:hypothetical protein
MKLMDLFIDGGYYLAHVPNKRIKIEKNGKKTLILNVQYYGIKDILFPQDFDRMASKNPSLKKVGEFLKNGELTNAVATFKRIKNFQYPHNPHFFRTGVKLLTSLDSQREKSTIEGLIDFIFKRDLPGDCLKNYVAHSGLQLLSHFVSTNSMELAIKVYGYLNGLLLLNYENDSSFYLFGVKHIVKEAAWLIDVSGGK